MGSECSYDLGMAVALVYSTVCTEEVKVPVAPHIPHIDAWGKEEKKTDGHVRVVWLGNKVREARLIWFGHVQRRKSGQRTLKMELSGKRKSG